MVFFSGLTEAQNISDAAMQSTINGIVQPALQSKNTPGMAVAVHYNGQDYIYVYGVANSENNTPVTKDTIFDLASITKVFTTTLLGISIQQGKIQLTDPIVKYLPALNGTQGLPIDQVKVVDLATHTASFPHDIDSFGVNKNDPSGLMKSLRTWEPPYPIGTKYAYSNISFGLLGKVVENANGKDFISLLNSNILSPLNMANTFIFIPSSKTSLQAQGYNAQGASVPAHQTGYYYGGGALHSSISDMLQFLNANLGVTQNLPPILASAIQLTQQQQFQVKPNFAIGLGWQLVNRNNNSFITKNGMDNGFTTFIGFSPQNKFGVVVLANKRDAMSTKIGNQILNQLASEI